MSVGGGTVPTRPDWCVFLDYFAPAKEARGMYQQGGLLYIRPVCVEIYWMTISWTENV